MSRIKTSIYQAQANMRGSDWWDSIDTFAIGLSIVFLKVPVLFSVAMIGIAALLLSAVGLFAGICLGKTFGKRMEILGGLILIGMGLRVLLTDQLLLSGMDKCDPRNLTKISLTFPTKSCKL